MAVGYVYPAYECYKIVEKKRPDLEHLRFWCQYWLVLPSILRDVAVAGAKDQFVSVQLGFEGCN